MKDAKKSIITEAIAEYDLIQKVLKENTKEILRSVAKEEITSTLKESLNDDDYDIEDVEDNNEDVGNLPVNDSPSMESDDNMDDYPENPVEGSDDYETEKGSDDYEMDMTTASDEDVISVYKKLSGDDEIEVISPNEVIISDPVSGSEYDVKLGGGNPIDQGEMTPDGNLETDVPDAEMDVDDAEMDVDDAEMDVDDAEIDVDDAEIDVDDAEADVDDAEIDVDDAEKDEDELGENIVYEIELSNDDEVSEDIIRPKGHDKELINTPSPNSGDIDKQVSPIDSDSGDNLVGGFDDNGQNGTGDSHGKHIMEMDDSEEEDMNNDKDINETEEPIDESIPKGNGDGHRLPAKADIGQPVGTGAKHVQGVKGGKLKEVSIKYNSLLNEAKKIKAENKVFKESLKDFRKMLAETAVFSSNLTYATKLFLEHSTTSNEKKQILSRFDNEVSTIEESKKMYKSIASELGSKTPLRESIERKNGNGKSTSQSTQLNENRAYVDPTQTRIISLMNKLK